MTTFIYQIYPNPEEAEMMGGACLLAIVEADHFDQTGGLADEHILDELIAQTGDPTIEDTLDEITESMFISQLSPDQTRTYLASFGIFQEQELFEVE